MLKKLSCDHLSQSGCEIFFFVAVSSIPKLQCFGSILFFGAGVPFLKRLNNGFTMTRTIYCVFLGATPYSQAVSLRVLAEASERTQLSEYHLGDPASCGTLADGGRRRTCRSSVSVSSQTLLRTEVCRRYLRDWCAVRTPVIPRANFLGTF